MADTPTNAVSIWDVQNYKPKSKRLQGHHIDILPGSQTQLYAIDIRGWILGRSSGDVKAAEILHNGSVIQRIPLNISRPDVAAAYPTVSHAERSGFGTTISVLPMSPSIQLFVRALIQDNSHVTIGVIQARRRALRSNFEPRLQPLVLTNLGRSGSTWLTQLLGEHPQVVTYQPFRYEPRVASYWMEVLRTLSEPTSYLQSILTERSDPYWWIGDEHSSPPSLLATYDPSMHRWLGRDSIEELAGFCQSRIERFYEQAASAQEKSEPIYFAERFYGTGRFATLVAWELYPQTRQIILVRDLRDMLCSMLAFNNKTGHTMFGRERAESDESFAHQIGSLYNDILRTWKESAGKAYLLRYEDLVLCPEETLTSTMNYLELDSDPATIRRMLQTSMEKATDLQHQHKTSTSLKMSIGRWRRDLDPSLQAVCQDVFGDALNEFGYKGDGFA
jgi:hypothetical protein